MKPTSILIFFSILSLNLWAQGTRLLREPTVSASDIVFVYANDLWKVPRSGGEAMRLTSNEGQESLPHFSPDEQWIAFTAQYDGNTDVYVIPAEGGSPKRLTYHPGGDYVQGWTPEGEVMFRSGREAHPTQTNKFFKVGRSGGLPVPIDIPRAAFGEISPDAQHIAYVPITFWDPEWRNYRGGQAMPIWIVDMQTKELQRTPQPDKERHLDPVWHNGKVFYISERDYAANIWSYDPNQSAEKQITFHKKFDVKSLDACADAIVYEQGGYLHLLNPETGEAEQLNISVKGDMNFARSRWESVSAGELEHPYLSPNGKRAIFEHRGEIFTVPKEEGSWRNLTNSPGVADRYPAWSPKGDKVAWFSDASGEYQLVVADQFGENQKSYPLPNPTFYFEPEWSPNGERIAYTDTDYNIWVVNLATGEAKKADTDRFAHPSRAMNPVWAPDSRWIAYAKQLENHFKAIFAHNVITGETLQLTNGMADATAPVWDKSGKYLYLLASTDYGLQTGWLDMSSYDPSVSRELYCILLNSKTPSPTLPKSDEESGGTSSEEKEKQEKNGKKADEEGKSDDIDITKEGIAARTIALPLPSGNFVGLAPAPENQVFLWENEEGEPGLKVHRYKLDDLEADDFTEGVFEMIVSADRKHTLLRKRSGWVLAGTSGKPGSDDGLDASVRIKIDPKAEYKQILKEGWRFMRDFLYVDNVHGAPWEQVYEWYAPWIEHVRHRTDLNYVVDILSGEVAVGHSYVSGGDMPDLDRVPVGLLGCDFSLENGRYRISKIYNGESWNPDLSAPLAIPGLGVSEGDYVLEVNGQSLTTTDNIYQMLEQTAGQTVRLTVANAPNAAGKTVVVAPIRSEYGLRTFDWIEGNRRKVDELSGGKLAYVYIPNTGGGGFTSFNRYYFSQQHKKGVVLDERNNGGGSAADYMIDVMAREPFGYFNSKANDNRPWTTPIAGIWGPKVMIINERAGSGGDLLPYMFKAKELGPLVGTRTWGGLVGTWDTPRFIDGGRMVAPRGGFYDLEGNWAVEGEGVAPDVEVIQTPKEVLQGRDPQLEKAVETALELLKTESFEMKPEPAAPQRWKRPEGYEEEN